MKKSKFQKSYDVTSFLNMKRTKRGFVSVTVSGSFLQKALGVVTVIVLTFALVYATLDVSMFKNQAFVSNVLPFFSAEQNIKISKDRLFLASVSPLLSLSDRKESPPPIPVPDTPLPQEEKYINNVDIKNETSYPIDTNAILEEGYSIKTEKPKVLIVHTHGSESYTPSDNYSYEQTGNYRTSDTKYNMIRIGEEVAKALREKGIEVIHDKTINDYPSYNDSYNKAEKVINSHISKDPDIVFVFDLHRDAVGENEKFVCDIDGKSAAQVMIVCGTDTNLTNPDWQENLKLAVHIQSYFNSRIQGFFRPLNLRKERFNMHLTKGSLLFEVGASGNTMDEALISAKLLGEGLGEIIVEKCKK